MRERRGELERAEHLQHGRRESLESVGR